jgi:polar amino acid transport system substrate-binding protein
MNLIRFVCLLAWLLAGAVHAAPLKIYGMDSGPISFLNGSRPDGYAVELAQAIQRLGTREPIEIVPWARANTLAVVGPGVMLLSIVRTPERERNLHFAGAIFTTRVTAFASRAGRPSGTSKMSTCTSCARGAAQQHFRLPAARAGYNLQDETNTSETAAKMLLNRRFDLWFDGEELYANALRLAGYRETDVEVAFRLDLVEVHFAFPGHAASHYQCLGARAARDEARRQLPEDLPQVAAPHQLPADVG